MSRWLAARIAVIALLALTPAALMLVGSSGDPYAVETARAYQGPGFSHPFGTDGLGRDMLARTAYAAGLSLKVVFEAVVISFVLALLLGGVAGYWNGRWPDRSVSWIISLLFTVPFILIVVAIFAVVRPSIERAYIAIGFIGWAAPARIVRAEVMRVRTSQVVLAERALGFSSARILLRTVLPVCALPAFLSILFFIPELIGIEVGLGFFGLGAKPPTPSLGGLIYNGLSEFSTGWWLPLIPAAVLLLLTSSLAAVTRLFVLRP